MKLFGILELLFSVFVELKSLWDSRQEIERLEAKNKSLRASLTVMSILAIVFFVGFVVMLILALKG
ncbi:MAG: hypothetical protein LBC07_02100 [Elusimicrobiota bacterium]|jgi:hypothetical protein|nr:hypothetical protein [Elusimicrobiota bacterium]